MVSNGAILLQSASFDEKTRFQAAEVDPSRSKRCSRFYAHLVSPTIAKWRPNLVD